MKGLAVGRRWDSSTEDNGCISVCSLSFPSVKGWMFLATFVPYAEGCNIHTAAYYILKMVSDVSWPIPFYMQAIMSVQCNIFVSEYFTIPSWMIQDPISESGFSELIVITCSETRKPSEFDSSEIVNPEFRFKLSLLNMLSETGPRSHSTVWNAMWCCFCSLANFLRNCHAKQWQRSRQKHRSGTKLMCYT